MASAIPQADRVTNWGACSWGYVLRSRSERSLGPKFAFNQLYRVARRVAYVELLASLCRPVFFFDLDAQLLETDAPRAELGSIDLEGDMARTVCTVGGHRTPRQ